MAVIFGDQEVVIKIFVVDLSAYDGWGASDGDTIDITGAGTTYVHFGTGILGYFQAEEIVAFSAAPSAEEGGNDAPPAGSDPPLPPVYPYPYSTGQVYARENLTANLRMTRGDTFKFTFQVFLNGTEVDITGYTFTMTCRYRVDEAVVFQLSTTTSGITITDPTNGIAQVTVPPSATSTLPLDVLRFPYDIQMTDGSANITTVMRGTLRIDPDCTYS